MNVERPVSPALSAQATRVLPSLLAQLLCFMTLSARAAAQSHTLEGHVPAAVGHLKPLGRLTATNQLWLPIGLPLRDPVGRDGTGAGSFQDTNPPAGAAFYRARRP